MVLIIALTFVSDQIAAVALRKLDKAVDAADLQIEQFSERKLRSMIIKLTMMKMEEKYRSQIIFHHGSEPVILPFLRILRCACAT